MLLGSRTRYDSNNTLCGIAISGGVVIRQSNKRRTSAAVLLQNDGSREAMRGFIEYYHYHDTMKGEAMSRLMTSTQEDVLK
jgi:hypothetical protein